MSGPGRRTRRVRPTGREQPSTLPIRRPTFRGGCRVPANIMPRVRLARPSFRGAGQHFAANAALRPTFCLLRPPCLANISRPASRRRPAFCGVWRCMGGTSTRLRGAYEWWRPDGSSAVIGWSSIRRWSSCGLADPAAPGASHRPFDSTTSPEAERRMDAEQLHETRRDRRRAGAQAPRNATDRLTVTARLTAAPGDLSVSW